MKICDVAVNIFAKPYQTSLAILSLLRMCGSHIRCLWLQFEPAGSRFDTISPYTIAWYLKEKKLVPLRVFQPEIWFDCKVAERSRFSEEAYRLGLRFECALEQSDAQFLYLLHNDVFIQKDILGAMLQGIGKAFAIGPIGQCWNGWSSGWNALRRKPGSTPRCRAEARLAAWEPPSTSSVRSLCPAGGSSAR